MSDSTNRQVPTFQDVQREFVAKHPGLLAGTALPDAQLMRDVALTEALSAINAQIAELTRRIERLEDER